MVDFNYKIKNSDKFRQAAIYFQKHGYYCPYPVGTTEYIKYWDQETDRCLNGYEAKDGDWCSGYNYFYLNYCPILRLIREEIVDRHGKKKIITRRDREFADFYDYDWYYFNAIQEAEDTGQHMAVLKARGKGYSFKGGSMLCRNYYLIPGSRSYAIASETEFLTKDGLLTKAGEFMDFIDEHTAWAKKRTIDRTIHKRSGYYVTDEFGNRKEDGYKSEIIGVTLKNDPQKARGKRGKLILWEEAGKFKDILQAWQIARPSVEEDGQAYGTMIAFGTGGTVGDDFAGLRELCYNPSGYNIIGFPNIWDENMSNTNCAFFCPTWANMSTQDDDGKRLYMDKDGNSFQAKALEFVYEQRQKVIDGASDGRAVDRYIAEHPITLQEACLELTGNIFPKKELQLQLAAIRTNKKLQNHKQVGDLEWVNGEITWQPKKHGDITKYPLGKDDDPTGSIVIWEHPMKDPPFGLYIGGCLLPGEKVMTDRGLMNVEDVDYSHKLINENGDLVKPKALLRYDKVNEDVYELKVSNTYRTTTFTKEHPILVGKPFEKFEYKTIDKISTSDWVKVPNIYKKQKDINYHEMWDNTGIRIDRHIDNPLLHKDFWWFLGLWYGDGWCESNGYTISVAFNLSETDYIEKYKRVVNMLFNRKVSTRIRNNSCECYFSLQQLSTFLTENFGKYANGKFIPEWVKYQNEEFKKQLVLGYLASDGSVCKCGKYKSIEFVSINLELLEAFQDIIFSLKCISGMSLLRPATTHKFRDGRTCNTKPCYHLRLSSQQSKNLYFVLNEPTDLKLSKLDITENDKFISNKNVTGCKFDETCDYIYFKIKALDKDTYTGIVYNFECETHTFMCHHITTHNCDPYDHDQSGTNSLGSTFIYKRFQDFESYYDIIVAEYTGRPNTAEDYYENVRKLLFYYNAKLLYENERKGIFPYFTQKHCDYLLADQPDIISDIIGDSKVNRKKGIHMTKQIKAYGEGLIKEWLNEEYAPGKKNLTKVLSEPLLEELIQYNDKGNFDRVIALIMVLIYREQLYNNHVKKAEENTRKQRVFDIPLFGGSDQDYSSNDNTPLFTF